MSTVVYDELCQEWHPIARSDDLPLRHVYHGELLGHDLAVWRADDGFVNVWENRCLHRGVRLTLGQNEGRELRCQYHGWRYANRTGGCTYIPAHPADSPARTICNRTFPAVEHDGLVWVNVGESPSDFVVGESANPPLVLRNLPASAPVDVVLDALASLRFSPHADDDTIVDARVDVRGDTWLRASVTREGVTARVVAFVQPVDANRSVLRCLLVDPPTHVDRLAVLAHHNRALLRVRDTAEAAAAAAPRRDAWVVTPRPAPVAVDVNRPSDATAGELRVVVQRKWTTATDVAAFVLTPITGQLPTCQPGAHIDVHLPNGLVRQYSLVNGPGELDHYVIGVKREPQSQGGSQALHDDVREGDVLAISAPRNNFPLRRDSYRTVLIAGGIGATPLLSMAQALHHGGLAYELHYFAQSPEHVAFAEVIDELGDHVTTHVGLDPAQTAGAIRAALGPPGERTQVYICGPGPMLDAARNVAAELGYHDNDVHFEYFKNTAEIDTSSSFTVELARSAMTLQVSAGQRIIDVLRDNGIAMPTSCEQGACGTCRATVLDGVPVHNDVYLNNTERAAGDVIMTCVSRASSDRLVLDL